MTEDNVFEDFSVEEQRKQREAAILQNLSKIIPNAGSWATEEILFPLYAPTALVKYSMELVGGPDIPNAATLNNFIDALEAEQYAAGTGPIEGGTYDFTSSGIGLVGGAVVYEAALDKIKTSKPKVYARLTQAFPYWVDHVHNRSPGLIKNIKGASKGTKALNFVKGMGKQVKHMVQVPADIRYRAGANLAKLGMGATTVGLLSNVITADPVGGEGLMSQDTDDRIKTYAAAIMSNTYGMNIKPEDLVYDMPNETITMNQEKAGEYFYKTGELPGAFNSYTLGLVQEQLGMIPSSFYDTKNMTDEESLAQTEKINKELQAEKERQENLPLNRKIGEAIKFFVDDISSRKLPQDIKYGLKFPGLVAQSAAESKMGSSIISAFQRSKDKDTDEVYDVYTASEEGIIEEAKDMAENERYMQDMMDKTLQPAPFIDQKATGGSPDPGQFTDSIISGIEEDVNIQDILNQSGFESMSDFDIFEEAKKKGYQETEVAMAGSIFGKAPMWAVGDVPKPNILTQDLTKNQKKILDDISKKLGTEEEVLKGFEKVQEAFEATAEGTAVGTPKQKKTIIDSPEQAEAVFYSGLEARLMDPNTPKTFNSSEDFYKFLQNKQISKKEVADNILENYIAVQKKNEMPLKTADMLKIVRQAPMRKVESVIYGNPAYGGTKNAKYPGYQEPGALPDSYRESVLYLDPKHIPQDPDSLPGNVHDFSERYVIGWSRKTDRKATLPVEKTPQGIELAVDPAMIRTLKRNQKKLDRQLIGLEFSALRKLEREGVIELDDIDNLTTAEIRNLLDTGGIMARLRSIDEPLEQQILQFRMKIQEDAARLQGMEATLKGQEITLTFADEIQSDILQQAKQLENKLRESLGSILDLPPERRLGELARQRISYSGSARSVEPEVLEFYTQNETIFRPMFNTAEEMQGFVDAFRKNKQAIEVVAKGGPAPSDDAIKAMNKAIAIEKKMLEELNVGLSEGALKQLFPNVPFKTRDEWGDALIKRDLAEAAQRLFVDKVDGAATWYAVTPANPVKNRYSQSGGTAVPVAQRTKDMKGIGTEEFYGGPDSVDPKGKHYTSTVEKALKRASKENNSEFKIIEVPNVGKVFAIKLTPEMLLPHKTHRKKGGVVYTPEIIDIFEAA